VTDVYQSGATWTLPLRATAPLTSLTIAAADQVYCGCWDKQIYGAPLSAGLSSGTRSRLSGHTDFVKCVLATSLNGKPILLSGGADSVIMVWDLSTGKQLHKLKGHPKALQDIAIDPLSLPEGLATPGDSFTLFSASSDREIRRWHISWDVANELPESLEKPILVHDTSVYKLFFDAEGDLWTASADKTAKHLVRSRDWEADTTLQHPDFVRDVVVSESAGLVVTACRDEEVRVWDASSGDLVCTYTGHFEEVTGLALLTEATVVSVSIDGTVRQWSLAKQGMAQYLEEVKTEKSGKQGDDEANGGSMMTAEEEAELAELMDDDDD
jgi:WD40 repeat protein